MSEEVRSEAVDSVVTAIEKHPGNYEVISFLFDASLIQIRLQQNLSKKPWTKSVEVHGM